MRDRFPFECNPSRHRARDRGPLSSSCATDPITASTARDYSKESRCSALSSCSSSRLQSSITLVLGYVFYRSDLASLAEATTTTSFPKRKKPVILFALLFIFGFLISLSLSLSLHSQSGTLIHLSPRKTDPAQPGPELMDCKSNTDQNGYCGFYIQDFVVDHSCFTGMLLI
ncbi:hypothetical protein ACLB2K_013263 [Fragaria x ananassa]